MELEIEWPWTTIRAIDVPTPRIGVFGFPNLEVIARVTCPGNPNRPIDRDEHEGYIFLRMLESECHSARVHLYKNTSAADSSYLRPNDVLVIDKPHTIVAVSLKKIPDYPCWGVVEVER